MYDSLDNIVSIINRQHDDRSKVHETAQKEQRELFACILKQENEKQEKKESKYINQDYDNQIKEFRKSIEAKEGKIAKLFKYLSTCTIEAVATSMKNKLVTLELEVAAEKMSLCGVLQKQLTFKQKSSLYGRQYGKPTIGSAKSTGDSSVDEVELVSRTFVVMMESANKGRKHTIGDTVVSSYQAIDDTFIYFPFKRFR
jgi:hypothetical protein